MSKRELASVPDLEEELDRLYGLPLDGFTPGRNDLARRLRAAGLGEAADGVRALRKPPLSAWAVNQLARTHGDEIEALSRAGETLVEAQQQALAGGRERFAEARDRHAQLVRTLTGRASQLLEQAGRSTTQATRERISETLRAASLQPDARQAMSHGRLEADVDAAGFSLLAGVEFPRASDRRATRKASDREEAAELKRRLREARALARDLRRRADKHARDAESARAEATRIQKQAEAADEEASRAETVLHELEQELRRRNA